MFFTFSFFFQFFFYGFPFFKKKIFLCMVFRVEEFRRGKFFLDKQLWDILRREGPRLLSLLIFKALRNSPWYTVQFPMTQIYWEDEASRPQRPVVVKPLPMQRLSPLLCPTNGLLPTKMVSTSFLLQSSLPKWVPGRSRSQFVHQVRIGLDKEYILF